MSTIGNTEISKNGLVLYVDAANTRSYPGTETNFFDLSKSKNDGTLNGGDGARYNASNNGLA